jgi:type IV fimbrial biogenesis protein FimT
MSAMRLNCANRGFTLIELLVTLTVAAILMSVAIPAFNNFVRNDRDIGQVNSLVASFNYARSEAVKRASPTGVTVCPSPDAANCGGTAWNGGWIVIDPANPVPPLQTVPAFAAGNTVTPVGATTGITFHSSGLASAALTIRICDTRGAASARDVEVNATGRVAASQIPGKSVSGAGLVCP